VSANVGSKRFSFPQLTVSPPSSSAGTPIEIVFEHQKSSAGREAPKESAIVMIKITPNDQGNPPGKLAEAELHFTEGPLEGLKLIGFAIWDRRGGNGRNVTFPARQYSVNGERRSFSLLRPILDTTVPGRLRELILEAFQEYEERAAIAS
jgi:hypothetical protein